MSCADAREGSGGDESSVLIRLKERRSRKEQDRRKK